MIFKKAVITSSLEELIYNANPAEALSTLYTILHLPRVGFPAPVTPLGRVGLHSAAPVAWFQESSTELCLRDDVCVFDLTKPLGNAVQMLTRVNP